MKIMVTIATDEDREKVFNEINALDLEWTYWNANISHNMLIIDGSKYDIEGLCLYLDEHEVMWSHQ